MSTTLKRPDLECKAPKEHNQGRERARWGKKNNKGGQIPVAVVVKTRKKIIKEAENERWKKEIKAQKKPWVLGGKKIGGCVGGKTKLTL